jgi:hypothetical protein
LADEDQWGWEDGDDDPGCSPCLAPRRPGPSPLNHQANLTEDVSDSLFLH